MCTPSSASPTGRSSRTWRLTTCLMPDSGRVEHGPVLDEPAVPDPDHVDAGDREPGAADGVAVDGDVALADVLLDGEVGWRQACPLLPPGVDADVGAFAPAPVVDGVRVDERECFVEPAGEVELDNRRVYGCGVHAGSINGEFPI